MMESYTILSLLLCLSVASADSNFDLRLVGSGSSAYQGRVEVYANGEWGTVCDDYWGQEDANVVCIQLGFPGASGFTIEARTFGAGAGAIHLDNVKCRGDETSIKDCPMNNIGAHNCGHHEDAGVICNKGSPAYSGPVVRLVGGSSVNEGRVEVYANGKWGTVCDDLWGMADGNVVCRQLGFPGVSSVKVRAHFGRGTVPILLDDVNCEGVETSILDCTQNRIGAHNCGHHEDAGVICNKAIRLAGARKNVELGWGIVEFYRDEQWGTVCGIGFSREDTNVACGQLGYPTPSFYYFEYDELKFFGAGTGPIWLTGVNCQGDEASLMDCELSSTWKADCTHAVDAEVMCKAAPGTRKREGEDIESIHKRQEQNDDEVCTLCNDGMAEANAILSDVTLQQDFGNMILQFCPLLSEFFPNCANFIQDEIPVVIQFLLTYLNPESCSEIGLCSGTVELQNLLVQLKKMRSREGVDLCSTCKTAMTTIDSMLSNSAVQSAMVLGLDQLCKSLGPAAPFCVYAVNHYTPEIIATLVTYLNPDSFCHEFRFCSSDQNAHLGSDMCTDCTTFFGDIDGMLTNQTVQNMILAAVDDICAELGDFADQCKSYADQYGYIVFDFLASQLSPQEICTDISFCPATTKTKTKKLALTADSCADCKAFFGDIDSMLMNVTVENMITAEILQVCTQFGSFADQCKSYVSQYAPLVYSLLASELNPDQICASLTFCPAQMALKIKEPRMDDSEVCSLCENVIAAVETYVSSQANQNLIIQELDTIICASLPSILSIQCKSLVKTYTPIVVNMVLAYFEPTTICTEVKLCPGASTFRITADPQFCSDCKAFLADIDSLLSNQTFQTEVLTQLEGLCAQAGSLEAECKLLIETYGPTLFALILSELDPTTDCTMIGLCPAGSSPVISKMDPQLCSECKTFLADAVSFLSNQTFENEILAQLEGLCKLAGSLQAECLLLVKTYGPAAFAYLEAELDPTTVCTEIGVCPGDSAPFMSLRQAISLPVVQPMATLVAARPIQHKEKSKATDTDCDFCKTIVGLFLPYVKNNKTEQEVLNAMSEVCKFFGDTEAERECENYVHTYGSLIYELLIEQMSPEDVCKEIGECTSLMASKPMKHLKELLSKLPTDDTFCTLCKMGVGELETILSSNKTKEEIKQEVEKVLCGNLPSPINTQCLSFMEIYGDVLVQLLIEQLDPTSFCAEIGLCDAIKHQLNTRMPPLEAGTECLVCEFMVSKLEDEIKENSTESEIRSALDKVCYELPSTVRGDCDALVAEYTERIVEYLLAQFKPKALCTALGLCDAATVHEKIALAKKMEVGNQETCILCEYIMSEIDKLLTENSTEAEVREVLDKVCAELPSHLTAECKDFVGQYTDVLISFLTQELDPKAFCTTIRECDGANLKVKKSLGNAECTICEFVIAELVTVLQENATQEEIKSALEKICSLMPATVMTECTSFVDTYEPTLIKLLLNNESPDQICTTIELCSAGFKALQGTIECDLCQTAVREFMIELQEPSVTKEVVAIVNETCAILPAEYKATCLSYVDQYGDLVTEFIAQFFDPITSCTLLEACPYPDNSPRPPKRMLGQHECTRGPGYWCASKENAKECNMVEHCKRHAWN